MKITISLLLSLFVTLTAQGKYAQPDLKDIPLQRLLANLEERVKAEPTDNEVLHQLARTHAMAYASKIGDADPVKSHVGWGEKKFEQPWFGYQPPHVPFHDVVPSDVAATKESAKGHLTKAIEIYTKSLAATPTDNTIKLGLAWCQEQAGEKVTAIKLYREVIQTAWESESKSQGGLGDFVCVETAGYLVPLLDPTKDAAEIALINHKKEKLLALPRAITPLIIPVSDRDDLPALVNPDARVRFDLDGSGRQLEWQWITNSAAWLVFDPQASGKITSAIQMFGSRSFLLFCATGYDALALLDDNRDGTLSGTELTSLALWRDANQNGISDAGEVRTIESYGITALSTKAETDVSGVPFSPAGVTFTNGSTRPTYDVILKSRP
jgi:hypothetical protein